jgi:hypothetical protein
MLCYFIVVCYLLHFCYRLLRTRRVTGSFRNHFRDPWNVVEVVWFGFILAAIAFRVLYFLNLSRTEFNVFITPYQELGALAQAYSYAFLLDSCTVFIIALKAVKFFALQKGASLVTARASVLARLWPPSARWRSQT